ncbi:MAG: M20/M25/M40 family metallo-hydrolase [Bacteroidota bacterium]
MTHDWSLLKSLVEIHAPSGEEAHLKAFLLKHLADNQANWKVQPKVLHGPEFQDCMIWVFGTPSTAIFAHMDSIGFSVRYQNQLVPIGGPEAKTGFPLVGEDELGPIECTLEVQEGGHLFYQFGRGIARGTTLTFKPDFRLTEDYVQSCYLDNRLGVYNALKVAETLTNGVIVFSAYEEHGGGTVPFLAKYIYEELGVRQALISDITWVTEGVEHGKGVAISVRDRHIPRPSFVNRIISVAEEAKIPYQLEVEGAGSSDGRELQMSPYPFDWCFVGAPEHEVHSPNEIVHQQDITSMIKLYSALMEKL